MARLTQLPNGRFELAGIELHSGDAVSIKVRKGFSRYWFHGRIEHDGKRYYFFWPTTLDCTEGMKLYLRDGMEAKLGN